MARWPKARPVGERAVLVEFPPEIDPLISAQVRALGALTAARADVVETVPAFRALLIILAVGADRSRVIREVGDLLTDPAPRALSPGREITVPVVYGGLQGPDLAEVARRLGLREQEVIDLHCGREYLVHMVGFAPGFPYLGSLPDVLRLPRRASPRTRVPAGSVAIADRLSGIYPQDTPGGWHLIGWTPLRLFDLRDPRPALCEAGDRVRFVRVDQVPPASAAPLRQVEPSEPRVAVLVVREPGLAATIQDGGRRGYRRLGVPWSGPMDPAHHALANLRAGNRPDAAAVEMTWPPPVLEAVGDGICAVAGPGWEPVVDGRPVDPAGPVVLRRGQVLEFRRSTDAMWAYVALAGGIDVPSILGSRATYLRGGFGGLGGRALWEGDILGRREEASHPRRLPSLGPVGDPSPAQMDDPLVVRVIPGPHEDRFTEEGFQRLLTQVYTVTPQIDRTGYRLMGPPIPHAGPAEILPEGMLPGAVQVPGDGTPIVLMADGPTTGGYPVIAYVVTADLPGLAQAAPGRQARFRQTTVAALGGEQI